MPAVKSSECCRRSRPRVEEQSGLVADDGVEESAFSLVHLPHVQRDLRLDERARLEVVQFLHHSLEESEKLNVRYRPARGAGHISVAHEIIVISMEARREGWSNESPYARRRARPENHSDVILEYSQLFAMLYGASSHEWKQLASMFRKLGNKQAWRRMIARRTCAFAVTLRRLEQVLGDRFAGRARVSVGQCWAVAAVDEGGAYQVVARVRASTPHSLEELKAPVIVEILDPMVDVERLRHLLSSGRSGGRGPARRKNRSSSLQGLGAEP